MRIEHQNGMKFAAKTRGHEIVSDLPPDYGGEDTGMTPPEWLLASLGSCVGVYIVNFCKGHDVPYEGVVVEIDWTKSVDPPRISRIKCNIHMPVEVSADMRDSVLGAARQCFIHNTLCNSPEVEIDYAAVKVAAMSDE